MNNNGQPASTIDNTGNPTPPNVEDNSLPIATTPLLEATKKERILLEEANKKKEELLNREERIAANNMLGGTVGGNVAPVAPKVLTNEEYSDKFMRGEADPLTEDGITI